MTGNTLKNLTEEIGAIFDKIDILCRESLINQGAQFTDLQMASLKEVMADVLGFWKSVRHQSAIKSRLRERFQNVRQGGKQQKKVITALQFLCRVYLGVVTFIKAAENMSVFQSIEWIPVRVPSEQSPQRLVQKTPMQVVDALGFRIAKDGWRNYLGQKASKLKFRKLRMQERFVHAELQIL
jgi:hypothetical protein